MGKVPFRLTAVLLCCLCSATSLAQSTGVAIVDVAHGLPRGDLKPNQINLTDCVANDSLRMTIWIEEPQGYTMQAWAGDACDIKSNRVGSTATCWQLYAGEPSEAIEIRVRDLLRGRTLAAEDADPSDSAACESATSAIAPQILNAHVLLLDSGANSAGMASWKFEYRLRGSPTPELASVSSGDGQLLAHLTPVTPLNDPYFSGVQVYCDPSTHDTDAAVNTPGAASDAGALGPTCAVSSELIAGAPAASLQHLLCGRAPKIATTASATGLLNGVPYNVALASVDTFGNVGPLSRSICQTPQASTASAQACSFTGVAPAHPGAALASALALAATLARHRRRARARRQRQAPSSCRV